METKSTYVNTARQIHLLSLDIKASCKRQAKKKKKITKILSVLEINKMLTRQKQVFNYKTKNASSECQSPDSLQKNRALDLPLTVTSVHSDVWQHTHVQPQSC